MDENLQYLIDHGMIDLSRIQEQIEMDKRNELLKKHPYKIWKGKNGNWYTYLPDDEKGRILKKKTTRAELEKVIIAYQKKMEIITFEVLFHEWADTKLGYGDIKKQTYDRYQADYIRFFSGSDIEKKDFRKITEMDLEYFIRASIHDQQLTRKSYSGLRLIIMGTFKYAIKKGYTKISISQFFGDLDLSKRIFRQKSIDKEKEIFTSTEMKLNEERIKEKTFGHRLGVICGKVGIEKRSMHKARKTCATNMINKGVDESLVISQLGHTDIKCTKGYYYFDNTTFDEARKQIERTCV